MTSTFDLTVKNVYLEYHSPSILYCTSKKIQTKTPVKLKHLGFRYQVVSKCTALTHALNTLLASADPPSEIGSYNHQ